jgi:transcriptional regulator with XRE-family HTH domain
MMSRKIYIGEHLRSAMKMRNMSESELSRRTQLAQQLISKYLHDITVPTATSLILMAVALNCSVDFLITGNDHNIVRCKNCIHWDDDDCEIGNNPQMFEYDWYCPCGEVKQNETD